MDGSSELDSGVHIAQGRDEHLERGGEPLAVAPAAAQVDQGFRKAEGEITPLTTTGTTSSPGIRRAKRSALEDQ